MLPLASYKHQLTTSCRSVHLHHKQFRKRSVDRIGKMYDFEESSVFGYGPVSLGEWFVTFGWIVPLSTGTRWTWRGWYQHASKRRGALTKISYPRGLETSTVLLRQLKIFHMYNVAVKKLCCCHFSFFILHRYSKTAADLYSLAGTWTPIHRYTL